MEDQINKLIEQNKIIENKIDTMTENQEAMYESSNNIVSMNNLLIKKNREFRSIMLDTIQRNIDNIEKETRKHHKELTEKVEKVENIMNTILNNQLSILSKNGDIR